MNILYTNFHIGYGGGHTTYILALLKNRRQNNYVACPPTSRLYKLLKEQNYPRLLPLTFPSRLSQLGETFTNTVTLKRFIEEHDIDIVHTNGSGDSRLALYASWFCKKKFKVIYTKHNTLKVKGFISKWRLNKFNDAVILVSGSVAKLAALGVNPRFHVVDHGIDVQYWSKKEEIKSGHNIRLVSNAGTTRNKGWIHIVEAISLLPAADRKRLSVVLLGREDPFMVSVWDEVREKCDITYAGFLDDPRPELEKGDVGFVLSYREASSFATREMMSMGLPVISSDFPNSLHNISPDTGWITHMKDAESIKQALRLILDMPPEELTAMKLAARERAEAVFSLEKMIEETNQIYDWVMRT